uniref:Sulfotransferase n=1 Tax=Mantoniella antarctica TaxID=81844 RepID=A0A7S0SY19_9CHLO
MANDWVHEQEQRLAARSQGGKSDLLFFLHIPRTAGRTFHFCYLKLAIADAKRCAKSYDHLRVDIENPNCQLLATHDDYSLVERLKQQPRVVTMLRDPVARFLSSYEFAVEVSVRSFGEEAVAKGNNRVSTRNVWPWKYLVRHVDGDLHRYKDKVETTGWKDSISNVYNNSVYTPLHEFVSLQVAHDDLHNGQFLQLLGLTNNSSPETEPRAAKVRACLRKGAVATEVLYAFAERRLQDEVDVTVVHERLDESLRFSSAALGLHMGMRAYGGGPDQPQHTKLLRARLEQRTRDGDFPEDAVVVAFVFKFAKLTQAQLGVADWRTSYLTALAAVLAFSTGVEPGNVTILPHKLAPADTDPVAVEDTHWAVGTDGFQVALIQYPLDAEFGNDSGDDIKLGPGVLMTKLAEKRQNASDLVSAAEGFDTYGSLTVHAVGRRHPGLGITMESKEVYERFQTLGEKFRTCEAVQRSKYARLKTKAFARLHKHVLGEFEPFAKSDRKQIPRAILDEVREFNHLDVRLHDFGMKLFDARMAQRRSDVELELLPPSQMM